MGRAGYVPVSATPAVAATTSTPIKKGSLPTGTAWTTPSPRTVSAVPTASPKGRTRGLGYLVFDDAKNAPASPSSPSLSSPSDPARVNPAEQNSQAEDSRTGSGRPLPLAYSDLVSSLSFSMATPSKTKTKTTSKSNAIDSPPRGGDASASPRPLVRRDDSVGTCKTALESKSGSGELSSGTSASASASSSSFSSSSPSPTSDDAPFDEEHEPVQVEEVAMTAVPAAVVPERIQVAIRVRPMSPQQLATSESASRFSQKKANYRDSSGLLAGWNIQPLISNSSGAAMLFQELPPSATQPSFSRRSNSSSAAATKTVSPSSLPFVLDAVFDGSAPTRRVYTQVVRPLVLSVLHGRNATVLAYGATNSGKTYTMQGGCFGGCDDDKEEGRQFLRENNQNQGVIQLAADDLFSHIENDPDRIYKVTAQYFEIYNEQIRDLLTDKEDRGDNKGKIKSTANKLQAGWKLLSGNDKDEKESSGGSGDDDKVYVSAGGFHDDEDTVSLVLPSGRGRNLTPRKLLKYLVPSKAQSAVPLAEVPRPQLSARPLPHGLLLGSKHQPQFANPPLPLREGANGAVTVPAVEEEVLDSKDVARLLQYGARNRAVASTRGANGEGGARQHHASSRSHAIFRITVESQSRLSNAALMRSGDADSESRLVSVLNLVDLAGSENTGRSGTTGLRRREGGTINQSLLSLSRVVHSLSLPETRRPKHINYRDSKLTRILQPHLSGNACMALLCCVSPLAAHAEETRSTMKFAASAQRVRTAPVVNAVVLDQKEVIRNLEKELAETKKTLDTLLFYVSTNQSKLATGSHASGPASVYTEDDWNPFALDDSDDVSVGFGDAPALLHPIEEVLVVSSSTISPPRRCTVPRVENGTSTATPRLQAMLRDAELRVSFLEEKQSATDRLVETLYRDLEAARLSNKDLQGEVEFWKDQAIFVEDKGESKTDRESLQLIKTAFYSASVFYATGQTELFLASVMFMWLSLEGKT